MRSNIINQKQELEEREGDKNKSYSIAKKSLVKAS